MKILYKYPTRARPLKFSRCLLRYQEYSEDLENSKFIISIDEDDDIMNNNIMIDNCKKLKNVDVCIGKNKSKIEAINADIPDDDWDILVLISDDMIPEIKGFDNIIRQNMKNYYPDTDGVLWFFDGWRKDLNTLCILGRKYYERFGYIYHPSYKSFWCDTEFTEVANILNKQTFIDKVIIRHLHPDIVMQDKDTRIKFAEFMPEFAAVNSFGHDKLWQKNSLPGDPDKNIYEQRKQENFNIQEK